MGFVGQVNIGIAERGEINHLIAMLEARKSHLRN